MALLRDILYKVELLEKAGATDVEVSGLAIDNRHVRQGWLFAAVRGTKVDGHDFIDKAVEAGAIAIVCEVIPREMDQSITYIRVKDSARAIGIIASNFYGNPSEQLKLVGITGTNGKTTVATLMYQMFRELGYKVGLLSTVVNRIHDTEIPATHTTPDAISLNALLADMVASGCTYAFMEVSSHSLQQQRVAGIHFSGAIFTNLTHDHLDYHGSFDSYIKAKKLLFDGLPSTAWALLNADDKRSAVMVQNSKARAFTYALKAPSDFHGKVLENTFDGLAMQIDGQEMYSKLVGGFNAYNMLAVYGAARLLEIEAVEALKLLSRLEPAEGRFDHFTSPDNVTGIIDYAHTPDALEQVLKTIQAIRTGNEQLITVVGCGGDRDKAKRPKMAAAAAKLSDRVLLTSDNPRSEKPEQIIAEMKVGVLPHLARKVLTITDRREAIEAACAMAQPGDIVLVAGKGHEKFQEILGERIPFDDKAILLHALNTRTA